MGGFKKGKIAGTAVVSAYCKSLKLPEIQALPKNRPREWRVGLKISACVRWSFGRWF